MDILLCSSHHPHPLTLPRRRGGCLPPKGKGLGMKAPLSIRRRTSRGRRHINWDCKTYSNKKILVGGIHNSGHDPDDFTVAIEQWSARIAGVDRRVNLNHTLQFLIRIRGLKGAVETEM